MLSWQLHAATLETPHTKILNMAGTIFDQIHVSFEILSCIIHTFGIIYHLYARNEGDSTKYYPMLSHDTPTFHCFKSGDKSHITLVISDIEW